jgi:hypothetical protein
LRSFCVLNSLFLAFYPFADVGFSPFSLPDFTLAQPPDSASDFLQKQPRQDRFFFSKTRRSDRKKCPLPDESKAKTERRKKGGKGRHSRTRE